MKPQSLNSCTAVSVCLFVGNFEANWNSEDLAIRRKLSLLQKLCKVSFHQKLIAWNLTEMIFSYCLLKILLNVLNNKMVLMAHFLFLLWVRWHRTNFRTTGSKSKIFAGVEFYQQSDARIEPGTAGWEVRTPPLCYAVPLVLIAHGY